MINCEIELDLTWSKNCVISKKLRMPEVVVNPSANPPVQEAEPTQTKGATFQINNAKHYVPVVTLSINDNIKFSEKKIYIKKYFKEQLLEINIEIK